MISQPLTERDKAVQLQNEFPWKCVKFGVLRFAFWPMEDHGIIKGQTLWCTKDYFYFYPQIFPYLFANPLGLEMGRWHMGGFSESSSPNWADCKSSAAPQIYSITQRAFTPDVCFTRGLWRKDLFSTCFGMAHMFLTIYLLEPKKHLKFLEPEDSVLSITLILEIAYKSYTTKIFHLHINRWLKDLKALLLTMKLYLRGGMWAFCIPSGVMQAPR